MRIPLESAVSFVAAKLNEQPSFIPMPDWTHLNVTTKKTIVLDFDEIYIDDISCNPTKVETHTGEEIEILKNSFAQGADLKEFPPAVVFRGDHYDKPYILKYGFGRSEALLLNKQKSWFFTLLEGDEDALEDVQAAENEFYPKRINKEVDMKKFLATKVREGKVANTEKDIREKFRKVYANRSKEVVNRVVQQVMEDLNTPQPYILYTSTPRIKQWIDNHSVENYVTEGEYDAKRDMYGVHIKETYQYRTVIAAIERYQKTGKYTYIIGHFDSPTKKATLHSKRLHFLDRLNAIKEALMHCGLQIWPIVVEGFLPQDRETENIKRLIKVSEVI